MVETPKPPPFHTRLSLEVIRSFFGDLNVKVDRRARLVTIRARGKKYFYTYDQIVDELEKMFNDGRT